MATTPSISPPIINNSDTVALSTVRRKATPLSGNDQRDAPVAEVDQVQLTPESTRLRQQLETSEKKPPMNEPRIKALQQAIAEDRYQVNSDRVARKMFDLEKNLVRVTRHA